MKRSTILTAIILAGLCCFGLGCGDRKDTQSCQCGDVRQCGDIRQLFENMDGAAIFDFESGAATGWQVETGDVNIVVSENIKDVMNSGKQGRYFLTTGGKLNDISKPMGTIKSPVFELKKGWITFLIGGSILSERYQNYVALCLEDGSEVLKAESPGGDLLQRVEWDSQKYVGKKVFLRVVDNSDKDKGYTSFDDFKEIDYQHVKSLKKEIEERRLQKKKDYLEDKDLFAQGSEKIYAGENLTAIDFLVGGIGSGCIHMDGKAQRPVWEIFNEFTNTGMENTFFAIRAMADGSKAEVRALQTQAVGPFEAMKSLSMKGEYPFAWYQFEDEALPVRVNMEAFNFLIPFDAKNSAIPCAIFNISVTNNGPKTVNTSLLATQRNPVCKQNKGQHKNQTIKKDQASILRLDAPGFGDISLASLGSSKIANYWSDINSLHQDFISDGQVDTNDNAESMDGAVVSDFQLKPGQTKNVTFVLTWYFPNAGHGMKTGKSKTWNPQGNMYTNWWKDSSDVLEYVEKNIEQLTGLTHLYRDTLYQSNLPFWLKDRLSSQLAVLKSKTVFWAKNGYIGGWEGTCVSEGCCMGNCTHVWHYAQAHARLFPEIGRKLRETDLSLQQIDGGVPHRQTKKLKPAVDGTCGVILACYREYQTSPDQKWLDVQWPKIKKAMNFMIKEWDADEDGVLSGSQWNTLDSALSGSSSWLGSLYLASLAASEKMAEIEKQPNVAGRYQKIRLAGAARQNETLFNGRYFYQIIDKKKPDKDYGPGCHIDQVLGQWWAWQVGLGTIYPPERVQKAMSSLFEYNFNTDFYRRSQMPRKFVAEEDAGMQMITWPDGGQPPVQNTMYYSSEVMSGFEYSAAATMIHSGLMKEGFAIVKAAHDRYDGRLRTDLAPSQYGPWGYSGNPFGDDECGKFYARSMSLWSVLLACQGFIYDGPNGKIGFAPVWQPDDHVTMFTAAEGYGLFKQTRNNLRQIERIEVKYGQVSLSSMEFTLQNSQTPAKVLVGCNDLDIASNYSMHGERLNIELPEKIILKPEDIVTITIEKQ